MLIPFDHKQYVEADKDNERNFAKYCYIVFYVYFVYALITCECFYVSLVVSCTCS